MSSTCVNKRRVQVTFSICYVINVHFLSLCQTDLPKFSFHWLIFRFLGLFTSKFIHENNAFWFKSEFKRQAHIQPFRERLSYKWWKAYATMSKVIMGNGGFYCCLSEPQGVSAWWRETAQTSIRFFSFFPAESPWTSIKQSQTLTTHNANRHCRVCFYTFVGQPLSKQLYVDQ